MLDWKDKTELEERFASATQSALNQLLETAPKDEIVSVYLTGSLARREINKDSDIDLIIFTRSSEYVEKIEALKKNFSEPSITFSTITLEELKKNIRFKSGSALPDRYIKRLDMLLHLYGDKLNSSDYPVRSDINELKGLIENIKERMIPAYLNNQVGFKSFIKNGIWLAEAEYKLLNNNFPKSWNDIDIYFKDKNHIIHKCLAYREKKPTKEEQLNFVPTLQEYISFLESKYIYI